MYIKMKTFMYLFLLFTIIIYKTSGHECGLNTAGVLIQQLTSISMTSVEGLFYDADENKLYFVDKFNPLLGVIDGKTAAVNYTIIPDVKYISAAIPIKHEKNTMIGLADNKLIFLHLKRDSAGNIIDITTQDIEVVEKNSEWFFIDSIVDKKGRLWIGNPTVIYNLTKEIYFEGCICAMKVAKDNTLWIAVCETGVIIKYNWEKKQYEQVHNFPALYITSMELGGPEMDIVFVSTNKLLDDKTPAAGSIFAISGTGSKGIPSNMMFMPSTKSLSKHSKI